MRRATQISKCVNLPAHTERRSNDLCTKLCQTGQYLVGSASFGVRYRMSIAGQTNSQSHFVIRTRPLVLLWVFSSLLSLLGCDDTEVRGTKPNQVVSDAGACSVGTLSCQCSAGKTCSANLTCSAAGICVAAIATDAGTCSVGTLNCQCSAGKTCSGSLSCSAAGICVAAAATDAGTCSAGTLNCQ